MDDLTKENIQNMYGLSPIQEGMLYHSLRDEDSHAYFEQASFSIKGDLNIENIEKSFNHLIKRYDIFRTVFIYKKVGRPVQVVLKARTGTVRFEDISQLSETDRQSYLDEFKIDDRNRGFDLSQDIPIRMTVIKTGPDSHTMIWSFHHIIMDGWCLGIVYNEFLHIYEALQTQRSVNLQRAVPYRDYIKWLDKQDKDEGASYWEAYLAGYETNVSLPQKNEGIIDEPYHQKRILVTVDEMIRKGLENKAQKNNTTLNIIFQAIWGILLQRYNYTDDVVFGKVVSGRPHEIEGVESMVGLFINTLPIRIRCQGTKTFSELLREIQTAEVQSEKFVYYPLAEIQSRTGVKIDHLLVFENYPLEANLDSDKTFKTGFSIENIDFFEQTNYDFGIVVMPGDNLKVRFTYNANVYDDNFIQKIVDHFKLVLETVTVAPDSLIKDLNFLTPAERSQLIEEFNTRDWDKEGYETTIPALFEEQAARNPERIAVVYEDQRLTYDQLNRKANQLAGLLREKGVKADMIVGLIMERSVAMIVGILGILKAGGAYLPIDPDYPESRIAYLLEDSGVGIVLTQNKWKSTIPFGGEIIGVDEERHDRDGGTNVQSGINPHHLAYVIYTSGTTGKPKGMMIEHRNVVSLIRGLKQAVYDRYDDGLRIALVAPYGFDASVKQIFAALTLGHELHIVPQEVRMDGGQLKEYYCEHRIDISDGTPAHLALLSQAMESTREMITIKEFIIGGEALGSSVIDGLLSKIKGAKPKITNVYGPTECTVDTTAYLVDEEQIKQLRTVPIGKPLVNWQVYILGKNRELLPQGIAGELHIGGRGVGRGYLNRPELTAEKFVDNPFVPGERIYRTGDLARWLPDGNIEFLGRIDQQVKIRGYRIELGEIETHLLKHDLIKAAVVLDREGDGGNKYLCAYLVTNGELTLPELREYLAKELPEYMIPSYFMRLEQLPLTANGKVDRKALPEPDGQLNMGVAYVAPRNEKEEVLVKVWQEVLKAERIGIRENFFNLGGDSIKAIQVLSRLNGFGYKLDLRDLFKYPEIEELSQRMTSINRKIAQGAVTGEVKPTPIQCRLFEQNFKGKHHFNQAVTVYRKEGFAEEALRRVLTKLVEHHDALRMVLHDRGKEMTLINRGVQEGMVHLEVQDLKGVVEPEAVIERASEELQGSLDLTKGPLVKAGLFKTEKGDHLCLVIHHLVVDGISWRILLEDLASGYLQAIHKKPIQFKAKSDSFKTWSEKLRIYANSKELLDEGKYWQGLEKIALKPVPKDHDVALRNEEDSESIRIELLPEETANLLKRVNHAYNTDINDILLTALGLAVKAWTGEARILIDLEGHGREGISEDVDISRTVGWFTTRYPVLLDLTEKDLGRQIKKLKESLRRIPHKGIGYGVLKYLTDLENKKGLTFNLKPEISFNYLGQIDRELENGVFQGSWISPGRAVAPDFVRPYAIDLNGMVKSGKLTFDLNYNRKEYHRETMMALADRFKDALNQIIDHCMQISVSEPTPSDFSSQKLTLEDVETIWEMLPEKRAAIKDIYTLAPMQEGMLYHVLLDNQSQAYFEQVAVSLRGTLDLKWLEAALNRLIGRYDVLRTVFFHQGLSRPVQVVLNDQPVKIAFLDLSQLPAEEKEAQIEAIKAGDRSCGFDLGRDSLLRVTVLKTESEAYRLIWSNHHIIMDGWCLGIVFEELFHIYQALKEHRLPGLDRVYPYNDYIRWLEGRDKQAAAAYWDGYLKDYEQAAALPRLKSPSGEEGYDAKEQTLVLNAGLTKGLEATAKSYNTTLNTVVQAVWGILLQRYNNVDDVVFGAVISGRPAEIAGVEKMVGLFINTVPVRVTARDGQRFSDLLAELTESTIQAEKYGYYPLAEIQSRTSLKQDLIKNIIVFENYPLEEAVGPDKELKTGFRVENVSTFQQTNYDFNLVVIPGEELTVTMSYNGKVYDENVVAAVKGHFKTAIGAILGDSRILIQDIDILTESEKLKLLVEFNDTEACYPGEKTIQALFEERVAQIPDRIAVTFGDQQLSYKTLNRRANQLARVLQSHGVKAGEIVGMMAERSTAMIVAILAVLKAGGAYLPIDPAYPTERINYTLADSGTRILLTQDHLEKDVAFSGITVNLEDESLYQGEDSNPVSGNQSEDLAYIIYTSGTTGKPKGVMISHRNVVRLLFNDRIQFDFNERDVWTMFHSYCFDFSVWEMYGALLYGGRLVLVEKAIAQDPRSYRELLKREEVTVLNQTPTAFYGLINEELTAVERDLEIRYVIFGGEALNPILLKGWREKYPRTRLINMYGITETTVHVTSKEITELEINLNISNIGKPIPTLTTYIMNSHLKLVPIGTAGELCVGGDGVGMGYLNRPELTDQKFVRNPYRPFERLYRSGDLVRMLANGDMEYLGRIDHQVKIRGFRIELGEIESQLLKYERVQEGIVLARQDSQGNKYLCAYLVTKGEVTVSELRNHLTRKLPDYMVPSHFIVMEKLPLTSNGKVDRKALPEPEGHLNSGVEYIAPRNEKEEIMVKVWQDVLKAEKVGIKDNFFDFGGDSIKAIQVLSRVNSYGYKIEMKDLFKYPVLEDLCGLMQPVRRRIEQGPVVGELGLTPIQCWLFEQNLEHRHHFNQAVMVYRKEGFKEEILGRVFNKLTEHHDALRLVVKTEGEKVHLFNRGLDNTCYALEVHDLRGRMDWQWAVETMADEIQRSINLATGPLLKAGLFQTPEGDHLLIVIHHLAVDGVSWRILLEDLATGYQQASNHEVIQFRDKSDSFKTWSDKLASYANSNELLKEIGYWQRLENLKIEGLPRDRQVAVSRLKDIEQIRVELDREESEHLLKQVNKAYNTEINDILLTALGLAVKDWTASGNVFIDLEGHGREDIINDLDLSRTVGWFTALYPVLLDMNGQKTLDYWIKSVKESLRNIPKKGVGYGIIKYLTSPEYKSLLSFKHKPEISFNYLGQFDRDNGMGIFAASTLSTGKNASPETSNPHALSISGWVMEGKLTLSVSYDKNEFQQQTIEKFAQKLKSHLLDVVAHCLSKKDTENTPSDFNVADLSYETFNDIEEMLQEIE